MDTITLDGKVYLKAAKAADLVGYTADYIGQLCRKKELEAIMLGKTWYVHESSLLAHKQSQRRVNFAATKRDIAKQIQTLHSRQRYNPGVGTTLSDYEDSKRIMDTAIRYSPDSEELLPQMAKEPVSADTTASYQEIERVPSVIEDSPLFNAYISEIDESHVRPGTFAGDTSYDEEECSIPIRKMRERAGEEQTEYRDPVSSVTIHTELSDEEEDQVLVSRGSPETIRRVSKTHGVSSRHPILSTVSVLALLFILANLLLEGTWIYSSAGSKRESLQTTYNLASIRSTFTNLRR